MPANHHLLFEMNGILTLSTFRALNHSRPSIDLCMRTSAEASGRQTIGILLSGANRDGVEGMIALQKAGGMTLVQEPEDAEIPVMPLFFHRKF